MYGVKAKIRVILSRTSRCIITHDIFSKPYLMKTEPCVDYTGSTFVDEVDIYSHTIISLLYNK